MLGKVTDFNILIRLYIEPEADKKSKGGIILPPNMDDETLKAFKYYRNHKLQGDVVQVGSKVREELCGVGDRVYLQNIGPDLVEDSIFYSIVRESDIIYVIKKDDWNAHLLTEEEKSNSVADVTT